MQESRSKHYKKKLKNCLTILIKKLIFLILRIELDRKKGIFGKISGCYYYE